MTDLIWFLYSRRYQCSCGCEFEAMPDSLVICPHCMGDGATERRNAEATRRGRMGRIPRAALG